MKYALAVTAIVSIASSTSAFEIDLKFQEAEQLRGSYLISDLTVGSKARVTHPCQENGKLFVFDTEAIEPRGDFIAMLKPNGSISLEFSPVDYMIKPETELYKSQRPIIFNPCEFLRSGGYSGNLIEVDDIDGFTTYSEWAQSVIQRFPLKE